LGLFYIIQINRTLKLLLIFGIIMTLPDINCLKGFNTLIREIYGDLAKPGVTQIGYALGTVV